MAVSLHAHLLLDNYGTHKTPLIQRRLAKRPRYHLHFTPTGATWAKLASSATLENDRIAARKLADRLRLHSLRAVYHGKNGLRTLKERVRAYLTLGQDLVRVMNRVKAIYRSWGIPCAGERVYNPRHREAWLRKVTPASVRHQAEIYTSSSTHGFAGANKRGERSSLKARSTRPGNCFVRFRPWARSARPCSWPLSRRRIGSAPS